MIRYRALAIVVVGCALLLAGSVPGHAMRGGPNPPQGTVIGKALEGLDVGQGTGVIQALVTLQ